MIETELREKAEWIVRLTLGNCALEADYIPVSAEFREQMVQDTIEELRSGVYDKNDIDEELN